MLGSVKDIKKLPTRDHFKINSQCGVFVNLMVVRIGAIYSLEEQLMVLSLRRDFISSSSQTYDKATNVPPYLGQFFQSVFSLRVQLFRVPGFRLTIPDLTTFLLWAVGFSLFSQRSVKTRALSHSVLVEVLGQSRSLSVIIWVCVTLYF